jgi:hypothetical protein
METNPVGRRKDRRTGLDVVREEAVPLYRYLKSPAVHVTVNHASETAHAYGPNSLLTQQMYLGLMKSCSALLPMHR